MLNEFNFNTYRFIIESIFNDECKSKNPKYNSSIIKMDSVITDPKLGKIVRTFRGNVVFSHNFPIFSQTGRIIIFPVYAIRKMQNYVQVMLSSGEFFDKDNKKLIS